MSSVTNVIIAEYGAGFDYYMEDYIKKLNNHCELERGGFLPVDFAGSMETGGSKFMLGSIIMGGFNYLNRKKFIQHLKTFDWEGLAKEHNRQRPHSVDLFYLIEDEENGYTHIQIYRKGKHNERRSNV